MSKMNTDRVSSKPNPVTDYAEAIERVKALQALDTEAIQSLCRTELMTHERKVERAIVFLHGYTNCPQQFHELTKIFHERGYNVLNARIPHHGLADRLTSEIAELKAEELATFTDQITDIAQGLGDHVTLAGISAGGVLVAWAGQYRADVAQVVPIAPSFAFKLIPTPLTKIVMSLAMILPNIFIWWDPRVREKLEPTHAYPRYSTHALGEIMRLGYRVREDARQSKPKAGRVLMITNAADLAVSNKVAAELVENWRKSGAENIETYEFSADLQMYFHDIIDPGQSYQKVDMVYPILIDLITK